MEELEAATVNGEDRFNLIDEPWLPIVEVGQVSLKQLFSSPYNRAIGGNPVQKIAITKFLLAIAQAAYTPNDDFDWAQLGDEELANKCLEYLESWRDHFYLYGERPFLQIPAIHSAAKKSFGDVMVEVATGNTTVLTQTQVGNELTDADKALLIVQLMGFALGGKKTDNSITLSSNYPEKLKSGKPGTSMGRFGFLHSFLQGKSVRETIWLNLLTNQDISGLRTLEQGKGTAPWEQMPQSENCITAEALKGSLMGRLIPLSRFCLLTEDGLHYSEGITHPDYSDGFVDPSISVDFTKRTPSAIWVDPEKRPWRILTSLLSFLGERSFDCPQLRFTIPRAKQSVQVVGIWSGGLRVSSNAGEQFVSGSDDFVESLIYLQAEILGSIWFSNLCLEMKELDDVSKIVWSSTSRYFKTQNVDSKDRAAQASNLFWQLCERQFQSLLEACSDAVQANALRSVFADCAIRAFDTYCAKETARQLDSWAKNRPDFRKYLHKTNEESV